MKIDTLLSGRHQKYLDPPGSLLSFEAIDLRMILSSVVGFPNKLLKASFPDSECICIKATLETSLGYMRAARTTFCCLMLLILALKKQPICV